VFIDPLISDSNPPNYPVVVVFKVAVKSF
jgi:hypothetical protein